MCSHEPASYALITIEPVLVLGLVLSLSQVRSALNAVISPGSTVVYIRGAHV